METVARAPRNGVVDWLLMIFLNVIGVLIVVRRKGRLNGAHAAMIFVNAFVLIIGVNVIMATSAVRTFPGLETKNTYVASQVFDAQRAAQEALGWTVDATIIGNELVLDIVDQSGQPVSDLTLGGIFGRPTNVQQDQTPVFAFDGQVWRATVDAPHAGNWDFRMEATAADGTQFHQRLQVQFGD